MKKLFAIIARLSDGAPVIWSGVDNTISIPRRHLTIVGCHTIEQAMETLHRNFDPKAYRETPNVIEWVNGG